MLNNTEYCFDIDRQEHQSKNWNIACIPKKQWVNYSRNPKPGLT